MSIVIRAAALTMFIACSSIILAGESSPYPAPRFPSYLPRVVTDETLLKAARVIVNRSTSERAHPGYAIKRGEKALMVVTPLEDPRLTEALIKAIREAGATVDVFAADVSDIIGSTYGDRDWGYLENPLFHYMRVNGRPLSRLLGGGQFIEQTLALAQLNKYTLLIANYDGYLAKPLVAAYRWEDMPGPTVDEFLFAAEFEQDLPKQLYDRIDELAWNQFRQARRVHVTDPEGTDLRWNLPATLEQMPKPAQFWRAEHLCMPDYVKGGAAQSASTYQEVDLRGVIGGTINHIGAFPRIQVFVAGGKIERIEGGGRFGDEWRKILKGYETAVWPYEPGPGFGWVQECGLGRQPFGFRPRGAMGFPGGTMNERVRSGVLHWAFGVQSMKLQTTKTQQYILEHGAPDGHLDVHNNFPTMILETAEGKEITFLNKGRLTILDLPEVRELAAKFGDPDVLLKDAWIPPVPGINVPGDYARDYGSDPASWIAKENERYFTEGKHRAGTADSALTGSAQRKAKGL
ncbi:MAG TPA: hypothetical protein VGD63_14385 [Steroidobacteraceae bacterium]